MKDPSDEGGCPPDRLRIVAICDDPPRSGVPGSTGDTIISEAVLERLGRRCDLTVAYFERPGLAVAASLGAGGARLVRLTKASGALSTVGSLTNGLPRTVGQRATPRNQMLLRSLASDADVVYLHGLASFGLIEAFDRPVVANEIDPLSLFWADRAEVAVGFERRRYQARGRRAARVERMAAAVAKAYLVVNQRDADELAVTLGRSVMSIPNGVGRAGRHSWRGQTTSRVAFVGALDHPPNIDSARMLCQEVLPLVQLQIPGASVVLAGRSPTPEISALAGRSVEVLADVPDVMDVMATSALVAFPGGFGRGTRNSVLEALRVGCPVVASPNSARGIARGPHLVVAADAAATAVAVVRLLSDGEHRVEAAAAAAAFGAALPTWDDIASRYLEALRAAAEPSVAHGQRSPCTQRGGGRR